MHRVDIAIVGAGVVGLAVAAALAGGKRDIYILERNDAFGRETSSRNSGVIHSGIYYPEGSLKARLCIEGNRRLYELCERSGIGYRKLGKLIMATTREEEGQLAALLERGRRNGAVGLRMLSKPEIKRVEPNVSGVAAILSPTTGIIDAHALMQYFLGRATGKGAQVAYRTEVVGIEQVPGGYRLMTKSGSQPFSFLTRVLINCAGLHCDKVAQLAGIDVVGAGYRLHYCKGEYFSVKSGKSTLVKRLIFPAPPPAATGVGIHVTFDLEGRMRLGPSIEYVDRIDYTVDDRHRPLFYESVRGFLPFIEPDDLEPEMAGIRPKLQGSGEEVKDFIIREESDRGLPGLINLIGIESPGLTASPAIARYVADLVTQDYRVS